METYLLTAAWAVGQAIHQILINYVSYLSWRRVQISPLFGSVAGKWCFCVQRDHYGLFT